MSLVSEEDLKAWTGYTRSGDIEKWLKENGVAFRTGKKGRICVTEEALNAKPANNNDFQVIEFQQ